MQRLTKLGRVDIMKIFTSTFRYIDELCCINIPNPRIFLSPTQVWSQDNPFWIYPLNVLEIKCEVVQYSKANPKQGILANFMNLQIQLSEEQPNKYCIRKYNKRREFPFDFTQYIKFTSNHPIKQAYSIVISQSVPILYISNPVEAASYEILLLIHNLVGNGFLKPRLRNIISHFLKTNQFPGFKFDLQQLVNTIR